MKYRPPEFNRRLEIFTATVSSLMAHRFHHVWSSGIAATLHMEEPTVAFVICRPARKHAQRYNTEQPTLLRHLYLDDSTPNSPIEDHTHPPAHATAPMEVPPLSAEDELLGEQFLDDYISGKIPRYKNRLRLEDDDWEQVSVGSAEWLMFAHVMGVILVVP